MKMYGGVDDNKWSVTSMLSSISIISDNVLVFIINERYRLGTQNRKKEFGTF